jgi:hypothetical protein
VILTHDRVMPVTSRAKAARVVRVKILRVSHRVRRSEMGEVLLEYDTLLAANDRSRWVARVCGRPGPGTMWEGWVEFVPLDSEARPIRSRRESTQPSRASLVYWATGLTPVYLKGALDRAVDAPVQRPLPSRVEPLFDGPAPEPEPDRSPTAESTPHPILDPFAVYAQGEDILSRQLDALDTPRLRDIVRAYELMNAEDAEKATRLDLATAIITAARTAATRV